MDEKIVIPLGEWYKYLALEVELTDEENFLIVMRTLERMGIGSSKNNKLYQSCHIFTKKGKIYITHFKELFDLDGREVDLSRDDIARRNTIAFLLEQWGFLHIVDKKMIEERMPISAIKIIKHEQIPEYELIPKYKIGKKGKK